MFAQILHRAFLGSRPIKRLEAHTGGDHEILVLFGIDGAVIFNQDLTDPETRHFERMTLSQTATSSLATGWGSGSTG